MSRRRQMLNEMGIAPLWRLRESPAPTGAEDGRMESAGIPAGAAGANAAPTLMDESLTGSRSAGEEAGASSFTSAVEAPIATSKREVQPQPASAPADTEMRRSRILQMDWRELRASVAQCLACPLHERRTQTVFGTGDEQADWLFVGEGPGADEDAQGEPFVGQAGRLLDNMLAAIDLQRGENVYIANVVKCRPPSNRNPQPVEMACCEPYLARQITLIRPKLIVALGKTASSHLLQSDATIASLRGRVHQYRDTPLIVTYHPAYLLRSLQEKAKAWVDLCFARETMTKLERPRTGA